MPNGLPFADAVSHVVASNADLVRQYLTWKHEQEGMPTRSCYDYAHRIQRFLDWVGPVPLEQVTKSQIEAWLARPRGGRAMGGQGSPGSKAKDKSILRGLFGYLCADHGFPVNPCLGLAKTKIKNKNPRPVPVETWVRLWQTAVDSGEQGALVALGLGFFVGLRREEICELTPSMVSQFSQELVAFPRKGGGDDITPYGDMVATFADHMPVLFGGHGPESFLEPLHRMAQERMGAARLLPWRDEYDERRARPSFQSVQERRHVLPPHIIDPDWMNVRMRKWVRRAGLSTVDHLTPHALRHSCVTYLLKCGVPLHIVSVMVNHSDVSVTMRYAKVAGRDLRDWRLQQAGAARADIDLTTTFGRR